MIIDIRSKVIKSCFLILVLGIGMFSGVIGMAQRQSIKYKVEDLGKPIRYSVDIEFVTHNKRTGPIAWAALHTGSRAALVGININTGKGHL